MRVADAAAYAAQFEGAGLKALGASIEEIGDEMKRRADQEAVHEYHVQKKLVKAELTRLMGVLDEPMMDANSPGMSNLIYDREIAVKGEDGSVQMVPRKKIPMHEVGGQYFTQQWEGIQQTALANVKDRRTREKLQAEFAVIGAQQQVALAKTMRTRHREARKAGVELQAADYIRLGDEASTRELYEQAFYSGVLKPEEYAEKMTELGEKIDTQILFDLVGAAENPEALEMAVELIESARVPMPDGSTRVARLDADQLWTLRSRAETKIQQYNADRTRRHAEGYSKAVQLHAAGQLTMSQARKMAADDLISGAQLMTLRNSIREAAKAGEKLKSNPQILAAAQEMTLKISNTADGSTVDENVERIKRTVTNLASGLNIAGDAPMPGGRVLTPADAQKIIDKVETERRELYSSPEYKLALSEARAITKMPPAGVLWMQDDKQQLRKQQAYTAAKAELDRYVNTNGSAEGAREHLQELSEFFTPEAYAKQNLETFLEDTPTGKLVAPFLPADDPTADTTVQDAEIAIGFALNEGAIDADQARLAYDSLQGMEKQAYTSASALEAREAQTPPPPPEATFGEWLRSFWDSDEDEQTSAPPLGGGGTFSGAIQ